MVYHRKKKPGHFPVLVRLPEAADILPEQAAVVHADCLPGKLEINSFCYSFPC